MLFQNERVIFEIPIYSMPKREFQRRWTKWANDIRNGMLEMGQSEDSIDETMALIMRGVYPKNEWKYNQIVGFVEIKISQMDIVFNVNKTLDTRIHAVANAKHLIQNMYTNGLHFRIENKTNEIIVKEIDSYLDDIEKRLNKPFCLNREVFDCVKKHVDYRGIQGELVKELRND